MIKLKILSVGKTKEKWLQDGVELYLNRLKSTALIECQWFKSLEQLESAALKEKNIICLDPNGKSITSEQFSEFINKNLENFGSKITFIIGDDCGLPNNFAEKFPSISLSKLTFTHQMTRLLLLEQIYRAFEIAKNSPYHK